MNSIDLLLFLPIILTLTRWHKWVTNVFFVSRAQKSSAQHFLSRFQTERNLNEEKSEPIVFSFNSEIDFCSSNFGISAEDLKRKLTSKQLEFKEQQENKRVEQSFTKEKAIFSRDALAKSIYARIFEFLIQVFFSSKQTRKMFESLCFHQDHQQCRPNRNPMRTFHGNSWYLRFWKFIAQ